MSCFFIKIYVSCDTHWVLDGYHKECFLHKSLHSIKLLVSVVGFMRMSPTQGEAQAHALILV
jgi:hypothetical protein